MLEAILGSKNREKVLLFILSRDEGYAREIARFFDAGLDPVQKQLDRLEAGGVLESRKVGRTRLYSFNPRCPFLKELRALLQKVMAFCPEDLKERLVMNRRRPRRRGKPL
jgi:predicted ArsR family transcriptional regulator